MKRTSRHRTLPLLFASGFVLGASQQAFPWGAEGHRAIGEIAQGQLSPKAKKAVTKLLQGGQTLASVSTWADDVRAASRGKGPLVHDPEAQQFNQDFSKNADWHFVNLALESPDYTDNGPFSSTNDVVHAINRCIKVLETPGDTPHFSKLQALRVLVHLVGDVHQPLHVATGYYELNGGPPTLITDPTVALHKPDDRGGNQLCYHPPAQGTGCFPQEVHAFWDTNLVEKSANTANPHKLAIALKHKMDDAAWADAHKAVLDDPGGDYHQWAEHWAAASVKQAKAAYDGIGLGNAVVSHGKIEMIAVTLPPTYADDQLDRATVQLAAAGAHLGHLLNRIQWK